MKFDEALCLLGGFGRYQVFLLIVVNIFAAGGGWQITLTVFIAGRMDHWCKVPELQHLNESMQKAIAIPQTTGPLGDTIYKQCSMFNYDYSDINFTNPQTVELWIRNNKTAVEIACNNGWEFDRSVRKSTVVSQFGLVCQNDWMYTLPATLQMVGFLFGAFLSGLISDRFGRKLTTLGMMVCSFGAILGGAFSDNFILFLAMRWLALLTLIGAYTSLWVLTLEMMQPVHRTHATLYASLLRILRSLSTLAAFKLRGHRWLQVVSACVLIPGLIGTIFLFESPRWLIAKGRYREAEDISKRIAKINKVTLPDGFTLKDDVTTKTNCLDEGPAKNESVIDLFRSPKMRKRTLVLWAQWFAVVFGYYAMSLNIGTLIPGDIYLNNFIINGVPDLVSPILMLIALFKMGRKSILITFLITNGILSWVLIGILPTKITALTTTIALCGALLIGIVFKVLYLYSGEIFPTPVRNVGLGSGSSFGRIGGLISPNIPLLGNIWYGLPYVILGLFPFFAGCLAFLLPETKDKCLPETILEAENFDIAKKDECKETRGSGFTLKNDTPCAIDSMKRGFTSNGSAGDGILNGGFSKPSDPTML
ncbi:unnamed protein product [Owenia fusiformis]|uniref:Uncharacterized protein n=1 Tax=Owenia fusiformis TaxID=6347 RepID=A0A8S4Q390_OWEFU|nr:unnamed protein product [Owenia fusiformis]